MFVSKELSKDSRHAIRGEWNWTLTEESEGDKESLDCDCDWLETIEPRDDSYMTNGWIGEESIEPDICGPLKGKIFSKDTTSLDSRMHLWVKSKTLYPLLEEA